MVNFGFKPITDYRLPNTDYRIPNTEYRIPIKTDGKDKIFFDLKTGLPDYVIVKLSVVVIS